MHSQLRFLLDRYHSSNMVLRDVVVDDLPPYYNTIPSLGVHCSTKETPPGQVERAAWPATKHIGACLQKGDGERTRGDIRPR